MKKSWTNGLTADQRTDLKKDFTSSQLVRRRLIALCLDKVKSSNNSDRSKGGYDCPNWAFKQADSVGYKRALHEVMSLLEN